MYYATVALTIATHSTAVFMSENLHRDGAVRQTHPLMSSSLLLVLAFALDIFVALFTAEIFLLRSFQPPPATLQEPPLFLRSRKFAEALCFDTLTHPHLDPLRNCALVFLDTRTCILFSQRRKKCQ